MPFSAPHSSLLRLGLAGLMAGSLWISAPAAQASPEGEFWTRLDQLVARQAYPAAELELKRAVHSEAFRERWSDRAAYWLGYVERRSGHAREALEALASVPGESQWYLKALEEQAETRHQLGEATTAIALYEKLLTLVSDDERNRLRAPLADLYFESGQFSKALAQYRELAGAFGPQRERAVFAWGWSLVRVGEEEAAINVWKQALERYPASRYGQAVRLALGNLLLARGDHLAASTYYNEAARQGKDEALMARAELLAGEAYADTKDFGLAISHYRSVPDDSPLREPAGYGEAYCTWQQGRLDEARSLFQAWLNRWPQSGYRAAATYALGALEAQAGRMEAANAQWSRVIELSPRSSWAEDAQYRLTQAAFAANDYNGAIASGRKLEESFPRSRWLGPVLWTRGESYLALSMYREAIKAYSQLAVLGNQEFLVGQGSEVDYKIGMAHFYAGNYAEAARVLESVADGALADDALFWQAEARYRLGQYDAARSLYGRLISRNAHYSRLPESYYGLGWASYRLGDFAGARTAFAEAAKRLPDGRTQQDAFYRWGLALIDLHDWEGARGVFANLLATGPDPEVAADARFQSAWSFYRQGRLDDAASAFGSFALSNANNRLAPQALIWQGRSYFRQNRYADAIASLKAAINHPLATPGQLYEAREQLAAAYHNTGAYEDARLIYEQLMQSADVPADRLEELRQGVVNSYMKAGNYLQCRREVLKHQPLNEADGVALASIAEALFNASNWDEVIATFNVIPNPGPQALYWAGKAKLEKQDFAGAIALLEKLRDTQDQELRPQALFALAKAYRGKGDLTVARETLVQLSEAFTTRPIAADALMEAADVAQAQHDYPSAQNLYRRVAENHTFSVDQRRQAWMSLGDLHRSQRQWGSALLAYRGAKGLGPDGSLGMALGGYWAGSVLVEMKQYKEALKELGSLKFPEKAEPLPSLASLKQGEALERLNHFKEASDLYMRLTANAPASERQEAKSRLDWIDKNVPKDMR